MAEPAERYAAAAVAWALARVGDPSYALRCLAFVEDAYERANGIEVFGGDTATESAARYGLDPYDPDAPPAAGSLVFYACGGPVEGVWRDWGHVGLALGDGRVVHAWDNVRVDPAPRIEGLVPASGWQQPALIGWTSADRVLDGHRPRSWTDG
jgi:cell wall-associated NlpC family hydrolase